MRRDLRKLGLDGGDTILAQNSFNKIDVIANRYETVCYSLGPINSCASLVITGPLLFHQRPAER